MGFQSEHDKVMEKKRLEAMEDLVALRQQDMREDREWFGLNIRGHEVPDPTPMDPPLGYVAGPDLIEQVRAMVRNEMSRAAEEEGMETFEEADDFDVDDDVDYSSPYEQFFDPPPGAPSGPPVPENKNDVRGGGGAEPPSAKPVASEAPPKGDLSPAPDKPSPAVPAGKK